MITENPEATRRVGRIMGKNLFPGSILALTGELGGGKTTLVQGLGRGLGIKSPIKSPSFVIIHEYDGPLPLYHFDFLARDTPAQGASLVFERIPAKVRCHECGAEYAPPDSRLWSCPECDALGGEIRAGRELSVASIEVE